MGCVCLCVCLFACVWLCACALVCVCGCVCVCVWVCVSENQKNFLSVKIEIFLIQRLCVRFYQTVSDSLHRAKNCHPETMSQIFPDIVSESLHLAKSCPPETMCRMSPNFAKLWSPITPKRHTMGAWQTPLWNQEVKIKLFKKKLNRSPPSDEILRFEKTKTQVRVHHKS